MVGINMSNNFATDESHERVGRKWKRGGKKKTNFVNEGIFEKS